MPTVYWEFISTRYYTKHFLFTPLCSPNRQTGTILIPILQTRCTSPATCNKSHRKRWGRKIIPEPGPQGIVFYWMYNTLHNKEVCTGCYGDMACGTGGGQEYMLPTDNFSRGSVKISVSLIPPSAVIFIINWSFAMRHDIDNALSENIDSGTFKSINASISIASSVRNTKFSCQSKRRSGRVQEEKKSVFGEALIIIYKGEVFIICQDKRTDYLNFLLKKIIREVP